MIAGTQPNASGEYKFGMVLPSDDYLIVALPGGMLEPEQWRDPAALQMIRPRAQPLSVKEDGENIVLDIEGPDAGRAIGKKGQTLDALQQPVSRQFVRHPVPRHDGSSPAERVSAIGRRGATCHYITAELDAADDDVIGCVYIYPSKDPQVDADVRSWVTAEFSRLRSIV